VSAKALLGLGSNVGDRLTNLQEATSLLEAQPGIRVIASSRVWETDPVGGPAQPQYLNAVLSIESSLTPHGLLAACHGVEAALGRVRDVRWGPRTIDVDLLLFDDRALTEDDLEVPHPRMTERAFVLLPLLEIEPDAALPDGTRLIDVPLGLDATGGARPFAPPLRVSGE
jgi:2-amino-4-hydroxy-6-hydroxymethyldihydropteridine diphosphokinase